MNGCQIVNASDVFDPISQARTDGRTQTLLMQLALLLGATTADALLPAICISTMKQQSSARRNSRRHLA